MLDGRLVRRRTGHRLLAFFVVLAAAFGLVVVRLVDLQVLHASRYVAYGDRQRLRTRQLPAARGSLLDRNGRSLAISIPQRSVFADPTLVTDPARTARELAPVLHLDSSLIGRRLRVKGRFSVLAHTVPDRVADRVMKLGLAGIATYDEFKRYAPNGDLARSLLGRVEVDGIRGSSGLEKRYNDLLTGRPGELVFEKAHGGGTIAGGHRVEKDAQPGATVYLTIDQALQYETERELGQQVLAAKAKGGTAIITRPSTGEILAMANVATARGGKDAAPTSNNVALTAQFEPGSVNKVITMAGTLQEGLAKPDDVLTVPDHLRVSTHDFTDHDPHPTAQWSVTDILATSSNIGTIELAQRLGPRRMDAYLRKFGFGAKTALDFPHETPGDMLALNDWSGTSMGSIPIGQGVAVTAMQMLAAYNVIANDGRYVAPKLVGALNRGKGRQGTAPSSSHQVVSPTVAREMRAMMAEVVKSGTGQEAAVPGYPVAGKTGTARKPQNVKGNPDGYRDAQGNYHYVSTFAGFVPADKPDLSIIVVIDEPTTSIFASDVSAPLFSRLASYSLRQFHIPPPSILDSMVPGVPPVSADARPAPSNDVVGGTGPRTPVVAPNAATTTVAPSSTVPTASTSPTAPATSAPPIPSTQPPTTGPTGPTSTSQPRSTTSTSPTSP